MDSLSLLFLWLGAWFLACYLTARNAHLPALRRVLDGQKRLLLGIVHVTELTDAVISRSFTGAARALWSLFRGRNPLDSTSGDSLGYASSSISPSQSSSVSSDPPLGSSGSRLEIDASSSVFDDIADDGTHDEEKCGDESSSTSVSEELDNPKVSAVRIRRRIPFAAD